jgi:DNA-binding transcriptional LysR family regulator
MLRTALHTQLNRVQTFLAVVDFGSFTKAADFLGISKAMASQHVKALEQALAVTLLVRTTRAIAPTETGQAFYDDFKVIVGDVESAFESVMQRHNGGRHTAHQHHRRVWRALHPAADPAVRRALPRAVDQLRHRLVIE